ncbi:hypothetical protein AB0N09_07300 [Streptomyces erythrochromogenes]|uniref:hypothetical protein n=1 Tax=Streptomyces erythrochromogenes TaxID=285574 RepID=UPI00341C9FC1
MHLRSPAIVAVIGALVLAPATALAAPARPTAPISVSAEGTGSPPDRCAPETHRISPFLTVELGSTEQGPYARITLLTIAEDGSPSHSLLAELNRDNPHVIHENRWMRIFEGAFESGFTDSLAVLRIDFPSGCGVGVGAAGRSQDGGAGGRM